MSVGVDRCGRARDAPYLPLTVLVTHDLDFAAVLADTEAVGPSVIQIRARDLLDPETAQMIASAIEVAAPALTRGAIVTIHDDRSRIRILPLGPRHSEGP